MPMVDLYYPSGSLTQDAKDKLLAGLSATCLKWEGIDINDGSQSVAWVYLHEIPRENIAAGGKPLAQAVYRVHVNVMVGFIDYERIEGMAEEVTRAVVEADGTAGTGEGRVFVIVNEVPSGTWAVDGKVWPVVFTAETLGLDPERVKRMAAAIESRPRLDVPLALA
jgi:phenylpyruvate tautomerase PptA (4-oxalocrotonate tautomerase family)